MFTVHCTKKLLAKLVPEADPEPPPTTRLGNWYANFLPSRVGDVVLFANERSLLPVVVPFLPAEMLVPGSRKRPRPCSCAWASRPRWSRGR